MRFQASHVLLAIGWLSAQTLSLSIPFAQAASASPVAASRPAEEAGIPNQPSAPPKMGAQGPIEAFGCRRTFIYQGERLPCDSNLDQDAQNLRPYLKRVPESIELLDRYQASRRKTEVLAYTATAGLILLLTSNLLARSASGEQNTSLRNIGLISGLTLTGGSLGAGIMQLQSNEKRLDEAVRIHNERLPQDPIQLQLETQVPL
jgi:hypothetical protein